MNLYTFTVYRKNEPLSESIKRTQTVETLLRSYGALVTQVPRVDEGDISLRVVTANEGMDERVVRVLQHLEVPEYTIKNTMTGEVREVLTQTGSSIRLNKEN